MANKAINDSLKYGSVVFSEAFATAYAPAVAGTIYQNAFRNWTISSQGATRGFVDGSQLVCNTVGTGTSTGWVNLNRSLEGYNLNRSFDLNYSLYHAKWANINYSYNRTSVCMCGSTAMTNTQGNSGQIYGLEIRAYSGINGLISISVWNNGVALGTPYTNLARDTWWYVFVQKRGDVVGITVNNTGVKPASPAFFYTMTDKTMLSNSLAVYMYTKGEQDWGAKSYLDNINVLLL